MNNPRETTTGVFYGPLTPATALALKDAVVALQELRRALRFGQHEVAAECIRTILGEIDLVAEYNGIEY